MKSLIQAVVVATVLAAPVVSFAQSNQQPVTRAQVRQELIQLEQAGYNPARSDPQYPADIQAAEQRVQAQNPVVAQQAPVADTSGYGSSTNGSSQAGHARTADGLHGVYFGN